MPRPSAVRPISCRQEMLAPKPLLVRFLEVAGPVGIDGAHQHLAWISCIFSRMVLRYWMPCLHCGSGEARSCCSAGPLLVVKVIRVLEPKRSASAVRPGTSHDVVGADFRISKPRSDTF